MNFFLFKMIVSEGFFLLVGGDGKCLSGYRYHAVVGMYIFLEEVIGMYINRCSFIYYMLLMKVFVGSSIIFNLQLS
jgi:hypothetical protein